MTKVQIKRSSESGKAPASADLDVGELAINLADRRLFSKTSAGQVIQLTATEDYTTDEKNKLASIAEGATANATDAQLRARSTHTGTQPHTTITGLGTAATSDVTTSATDTTEGRLLKVGDTSVGVAHSELGRYYAGVNIATITQSQWFLVLPWDDDNAAIAGELIFRRDSSFNTGHRVTRINLMSSSRSGVRSCNATVSGAGVSFNFQIRKVSYQGINYLALRSNFALGSNGGRFTGWSTGITFSSVPFGDATDLGQAFGFEPFVNRINEFDTYHQGNILGTVSESDGVPTGAIIERGSNANGEYVKYADGTQICFGTRAMPQDISSSLIVSYPSSFVATPAFSSNAASGQYTGAGTFRRKKIHACTGNTGSGPTNYRLELDTSLALPTPISGYSDADLQNDVNEEFNAGRPILINFTAIGRWY